MTSTETTKPVGLVGGQVTSSRGAVVEALETMAAQDVRAHMARMLSSGFRFFPASSLGEAAAALELQKAEESILGGRFWGPTGYRRSGVHAALRALVERVSDFYAPEAIAQTLVSEGSRVWARWGKRATAIRECGKYAKVMSCTSCVSGKAWLLVPEICFMRYCPECCQRNRQRTQVRIATILDRFKNSPRFLTLTVGSGEDLEETRARLMDGWKKFRRRKSVRRWLRGGIAVLEVTYNASTDKWHPHLHILYDGDFAYWEQIVSSWQQATGCRCRRLKGVSTVLCCRTVWKDDPRFDKCTDPACGCTGCHAGPAGQFIKAIDKGRAVQQVGKYCAKEIGESSPNLPTDRLIEFLRLTWGRRLLTTFGTHYDPELEREDEEIRLRAMRDEYDSEPRCPVCGSNDLRQTGFRAVERAPP